MSVPVAYLAVIIIWSTTPLGIQWSGENGNFAFGVALRMGLGLLALLAILHVRKLAFPWHRAARRVYYASGISLFTAMSLVYWSAQYIPSGWIAVIFGLSPVFTSLFSAFILKEHAFTAGRVTGMLLGLAGLVVVFIDSLQTAPMAWLGIVGVVLSAMSQSLGAVVVRKLKPDIPAISITVGSLLIAMPWFILSAAMQGGMPSTLPAQTLGAIIYLAILGTATGFPLYYYLLKNIAAERIALITLITPVTALLIGAALNAETIGVKIWLGTTLIITGLAIYEYGKYLPFRKKWPIRWLQKPL
ncbi:MAG TPA: DMT family transporter [Thiotrichales bacterium]|nr:DMT family transporter [Thiotrichales bacterium]